MMSKEENDLLTQTGSGSPAGNLLRRYWQPVALVNELAAGGAPLAVRILGEDLVLFRDDKGRAGLLGIHCSHRGTDLSYGRVEDGGLRCLYHGWLYDIEGRCLEQPGEPWGGEQRAAIRHPAYPCREAGGVIFTYMGPGEPPLLPNYDFLSASPDYLYVSKIFHECNYLQANEGNIDKPRRDSRPHRGASCFIRQSDPRSPQASRKSDQGCSGGPRAALYYQGAEQEPFSPSAGGLRYGLARQRLERVH
jgi:phthalate 4,5-dioxygenase oxygenase subunit